MRSSGMNAHVLEPGPQDPHCRGRCFTILLLEVLPTAEFLGHKHRVCLCILVVLFCERLSNVYSYGLSGGPIVFQIYPLWDRTSVHSPALTVLRYSLPLFLHNYPNATSE